MSYPHATIYTDGSYLNKYKVGGYAAFVVDDTGNSLLVGSGESNTTISRMELSAIVTGLSYLINGCIVTVVSDSMYSVNTINKWIYGWEDHNFIKSNGESVANQDIIKMLLVHMRRMHSVKAHWVHSHTNKQDLYSLGNAVVDTYAVRQSKSLITS